MNNLQVVEQREILGKDFKIYGDFENPLFLAKDVAEWIDYDISSINKMLKNVDDEEKLVGTIFRAGQNREVAMLTEDGLYEVLMQSRKPIAKAFKKQVKGILKDIRKHGMYAKDELLENPDLLIQVATELKKEKEEKRLLQVKLQEQQPKVLFAETVANAENLYLVREVAKFASDEGLTIGEKRLWNKLREWDLIFKNSTEPKQYALERNWVKVVEGSRTTPTGTFTYKTTKITGKGQIYIISKLRKEFKENEALIS